MVLEHPLAENHDINLALLGDEITDRLTRAVSLTFGEENRTLIILEPETAQPFEVDEQLVRDAIANHKFRVSKDAEPTVRDVLDAIRDLAGEGSEVESRILNRATAIAQDRAAQARP